MAHEFTGSPTQLKAMYESGRSIFEIMETTGKDYEDVRTGLMKSRTKLVTGGPHDTGKCRDRHNH